MKACEPKTGDASRPSHFASGADGFERRSLTKMSEQEVQAKVKLGILTCSTMTRVLDCPVGACLRDLQERRGAFAEYEGTEVELAGVTSCNGCATKVASTILSKVDSLVHYGADRVHLSYCMLALCPFQKRHVEEIKRRFTDLKVVLGTHESHQSNEQFRRDIEAKLTERWRTIIP